jgi:threonine dehydrogenase-like Zn-dependent dehydrogenase
MRALTWQGKRDVRIEEVPDPRIEKPDDIIVRVTSTGICGSDLHLYEVFGPYLDPGDILGHETMGMVVEIGPEVTGVAVGDRVVIPFNISCNTCWMCRRGLQSQCETTQVTSMGSGAALFGYTKLYGQVPGGQAEYLRVPFGNTLPIKVPDGPPDDRFVYLSDVLPTGLLPDKLARPLMEHAGVDRLGALLTGIDAVRRGGTLSISGVYGGAASPLPLLTMFDKQLQVRMGQANVWRWIDDIRPHLTDDDPLDVDGFATHHLPLREGPAAYATFQAKEDGMVKTLLKP